MIRFGIVGTGRITEQFLACMKLFLEDCRVEALYSRSEQRAKDFADRYSIPLVFTDLEQMAASNTIDAVYIASPNSLHASQSQLFLQQHIHVLCEKPFASNLQEAQTMIQTAKQQKTLLMEAMKSTLLPNFQAIQDHIHKIGKVRRMTTSFCKYSSRYDAYKQGLNPNTFNPAFSNGSLMDLGVYCIYPAIVLFGMPQHSQANGVFLESGVDGQGTILFQYEEMDVVMQHSKIANSYLPTEIQGELGTLVIDAISIPRQVKIVYNDKETEDVTEPQFEQDMYYEIKEFVNLIKHQQLESSINTHERSLCVMQLLDTVRQQIGLAFPADRIKL